MDYVYKLLEEKQKEKLNEKDSEQLRLINIMLKDENWINRVDSNTALTILTFLGIKEEESLNFYMDLLSSNNGKINEYIITDNIENIKKQRSNI